jgi:hypothetical protein
MQTVIDPLGQDQKNAGCVDKLALSGPVDLADRSPATIPFERSGGAEAVQS